MPRKIEPSWGSLGVTEVEPCEFQSSDLKDLAALLGVTKPELREKLKLDLQDLGCRFLRWRRQELLTPLRKIQSAGLKSVRNVAVELQKKLAALDFAAQETLFDVLTQKPFQRTDADTPEYGLEQLENLRARLAHLCASTNKPAATLKKQMGPNRRRATREIIFQLGHYYMDVVDLPVTHSVLVGEPQSRAGNFIRTFFEGIHGRVSGQTRAAAMLIKFREDVKKLPPALRPKGEPRFEFDYQPVVPKVRASEINSGLASFIRHMEA